VSTADTRLLVAAVACALAVLLGLATIYLIVSCAGCGAVSGCC
jgi:hypothetical protein